MPHRAVQLIKQQIGFSDVETEAIRTVSQYSEKLTPRMVARFYDELLRNPEAAAIFTGGEEQLARQREVLSAWLKRTFRGDFGLEEYEASLRIGKSHVRVGLPQHYMVSGMQLIWGEFEAAMREFNPAALEVAGPAYHKLLMLELAAMLESYKETYSAEVRSKERIAVEEKLTRAEHLAEIGQLAASLAHEIKNPLAGISGAIQIMRETMEDGDPHRPIAGAILAQIKRLDATVKDLLQYARPIPPQVRPVDLDEIVTRVLSVLREEPAVRNVEIVRADPSPDHVVRGDDGQLEQLLMNLIINAAHASEPGGRVEVSLSPEDDMMRLVIEDRGEGMSSDVCAQAFDPFFTTKAKGTGLGLSICRRIVEAHGGQIQLDSAVGRGTRVVIDLPLAANREGVRQPS